MSKKTIRDIVAVLRAVIKYGAKRRLCQPEQWELAYPRSEQIRKLPILSLSQQRKLMSYLIDQPSSRNIGVLLALCTGMPIGEVCALTWDNVDLQRRTLWVGQTVARVYNRDKRVTERIFSTPKTKNSYRELPISPLLYQALVTVKKNSASAFVLGTTGQATDPRTYRDYFARLLGRLRHTFATRCIESGCDYKTVSVLLGHSNVSTTLNLYVHSNLEQKKHCIAKMNRLIVLR